MLKGLRGDLRIQYVCDSPLPHAQLTPFCLTADLFNSPSAEHIVTGPIGAQLKPEELTRLGGSDRGGKSAPPLWNLDPTQLILSEIAPLEIHFAIWTNTFGYLDKYK